MLHQVERFSVNRQRSERVSIHALDIYDQTYGIDVELTKIFKIFDNLIFKSKNNLFEFNNVNQTFVNTKIFDSIREEIINEKNIFINRNISNLKILNIRI